MFQKTNFKPIPEKPSFPLEEDEVYIYWNKIDAFKKQLEKTKHCKKFTFYDGPPFATGMPHYGHILAGTIKDVVCRYQSQTGHHVERRFGWDCHGLPVEYEIDKKLKIGSKKDVIKMGIDKYNNECRSIVMTYSKDWRYIVAKFGRWIDFDNDYKTMDLKFMESVWAVFKMMWDKGLVYRGSRVMPYSNACNTVLSNFEVHLNYKEALDPAIFITFPLVSDNNVKFVAWTTTPWTLPSNLMICVNPDFDYVKIKDIERNDVYILAECRLEALYKDKSMYQVLDKFKGKTLEGIEYVPLFEYFLNRKQDGCFKVCCGDFVTSDTGTGVVHCAPGFGEDDFKVCLKYKVIRPDNPPVPLDDNGNFTSQIPDYEGKYILDANKDIRKKLKENNRLILDTQTRHNYPFCWRSDTPLIYKAVNCWFIKVEQIKQDLIANNKKAYWVPKFAQEGRFNNWLEDARDWCFSRNRFWGNPIPIWVSDDFEETVCVGSIKELMELTGAKEITDLHRDSIDHLTIPSKKGKGKLKRIEEVFDCWFESGSMPYGQVHYPFSTNEEQFKEIFPADFIGEGLDQTRGWFYTLNVVSTAIKNETPYKNLIVNGIVLASNGQKMSKRLHNYPDPMEVRNLQGADAVRLYLINSPLVRAEPLNFSQEGVKGVVRDVFLPWYNAYRFLFQNVKRWETDHQANFKFNEALCEDTNNLKNPMDRWVMGSLQNLIQFFHQEMNFYRLYTVVPKLLGFLENLTNWYVRLNRPRIKGECGHQEQLISLNILYDVVLKSTILMSPFTPFTSEMMYFNLQKCLDKDSKYLEDSVHFLQIPKSRQDLIDEQFETVISRMQGIIQLGRTLREKRQISLKQPIQSITIIQNSDEWVNSIKPLVSYIQEEINAAQVLFEQDSAKYVQNVALPNHKALGQKLKKNYTENIKQQVNNLTQEQYNDLKTKGVANVGGFELKSEDFVFEQKLKVEKLEQHLELGRENEIVVLLDISQDKELKLKGISRELINRVQKLKKKCGLEVQDKIVVFYSFSENAENLRQAMIQEKKTIDQTIKKPLVPLSLKQKHLIPIAKGRAKYQIFEETLELELYYESVQFNYDSIKQKAGDKFQDICNIISSYPLNEFAKIIQNNGGKFVCTHEEKQYELKANEDFLLSWFDVKQ